jgi:hypothetical protein
VCQGQGHWCSTEIWIEVVYAKLYRITVSQQNDAGELALERLSYRIINH